MVISATLPVKFAHAAAVGGTYPNTAMSNQAGVSSVIDNGKFTYTFSEDWHREQETQITLGILR